MPPQFLAVLTALPGDVDSALKLEKTAAKKSSQANAKALNSMKQKVKKTIKENEVNIEAWTKVRARQLDDRTRELAVVISSLAC